MIFTSLSSKSLSSSPLALLKSSLYDRPEQPPPNTSTRFLFVSAIGALKSVLDVVFGGVVGVYELVQPVIAEPAIAKPESFRASLLEIAINIP